jgi:hypothetical protein
MRPWTVTVYYRSDIPFQHTSRPDSDALKQQIRSTLNPHPSTDITIHEYILGANNTQRAPMHMNICRNQTRESEQHRNYEEESHKATKLLDRIHSPDYLNFRPQPRFGGNEEEQLATLTLDGCRYG